jgi:FkbM family methyltransferase
MVHSSLPRYQNLLKNISNWPVYFTRKFNKAFQPVQFVTRGNRLKFDVPSTGEYLVFKEIFVTDFYDMDNLVKRLGAKPVIIDIGANVGYFNIMLFSKTKDATVYAYEPIPANYELFKKTIALNPLLQKKIHLFNKAVTGTPQQFVELYMESATENSVIASVYADFDKQNKYSVKVPAISLQQIVDENKLGKIDLVKIDCEGSEYPIIYETPGNVWQQINMLTIEVHNLDEDKRNAARLGKFLEEKGFQVNTMPAHSNCYFLEATRNH